jgi:hypothetical protein
MALSLSDIGRGSKPALAAVGPGLGGVFGAVWLPRGSNARLAPGSMVSVRLDPYAIVRLPMDEGGF